jgi:hypothetical protein
MVEETLNLDFLNQLIELFLSQLIAEDGFEGEEHLGEHMPHQEDLSKTTSI